MIDLNVVSARLGSISPAKRQALNKVCPAAMKVLDDVPAIIQLLRDYGHPVTQGVAVSSAKVAGDFSETFDQYGCVLRDSPAEQTTVQQADGQCVSAKARPAGTYRRHPRNVDGKPGYQSTGSGDH